MAPPALAAGALACTRRGASLRWAPLQVRFCSAAAFPGSGSGLDGHAAETSLAAVEESAASDEGPRVYRRDKAEHLRVFRWGIGNKFRMQSQNRFMPVHKARNQECMVRDDYYQSDNPNIYWDELNETWEVQWFEHSKLNAKPFPVKKYGVERARQEAASFFEELQAAGRLGSKPVHESPQEGVFYDPRMQSWVCLAWRDGRPLSRCYAATKYGFDGARALAVAKQNDPVNGLLHLPGAARRHWKRERQRQK